MAVLKVIEVLSISSVSWEDATKKAVAQATKTLKILDLFMFKSKVLLLKMDK